MPAPLLTMMIGDDEDVPRVRDASQHEPHVVNQRWPNWGRDVLDHGHATFAVCAHLRTLNLTDWIKAVMRWLAHFDGFEAYVEDGDDPIVCVRDVLAGYVARLKPERAASRVQLAAGELKARIVDDLLQLEFLRYWAYWGKGLVHEPDARVWNSLEQPWLEFVESGRPDELIMVWRADGRPFPSLEQHRIALLGE